jgi:hypothetical protein
LTDSSNFSYNIYHTVSLKGENENFSINSKYIIIAYSDKYTIFCIIKPQFNKLNFNEVISNTIFNQYLINNSNDRHENNFKEYNNTKIITCILTLDSVQPIFINSNMNKSNDIIKEYMINKYSIEHYKIYDFYIYCKENKPKNKDSICYTYDELVTYEKLPKYIKDYFYDIKKDLEKNKKIEIQILGKWIIRQKINYKLKKQIMKNPEIYNKWTEIIISEKYKKYFLSYEDEWLNNLDIIKKYIDTNNKRPSLSDKNKEINILSKWIDHQKTNYKSKGKIMKNHLEIYNKWTEFINDPKYKKYF